MRLYDRLIEDLARSKPGGWLFVNVFTHVDRRVMRWTNGRISTGLGSKFGKTALLLTCIGRKSGKSRDIPLVFARAGQQIVLIASRAGHANNPAWYHNLKANPACTVRVSGRKIDCIAHQAEGEEREQMWKAAVAVYAGYDDYATRTDRVIPVMVLTPR